MPRLLKILWMLFIISSANAVEVTDLYQASVVVTSQANTVRATALKNAMQAVLLKVGGQQSVLSNNEIQSALKNYQQYVSQYAYERKKSALLLMVNFDEAKINRLFQQANLPIWGRLRPQIILWLVEEQGLSRTIIPESAESAFPGIIQQYSAEKGLPIRLPLMDLTDAMQLSAADVWGRFSLPVATASARYLAEASVIVRLSNSSLLPQTAGQVACELLCRQPPFALDWSLITDQQQFSPLYSGEDAAELLRQALADITDVIYQHYAQATTISEQLIIDVANVDSMANYVAIIDFLQNLSSVNTVQLINAQGNHRRISLDLLGSKDALLAALKLNKQLQQYVDPLAAVDKDSIPVFYWGKP